MKMEMQMAVQWICVICRKEGAEIWDPAQPWAEERLKMNIPICPVCLGNLEKKIGHLPLADKATVRKGIAALRKKAEKPK